MNIELDVTTADGTTRVAAGPAAIVAWEEATGRSVADWSSSGATFTDLARLAWAATTTMPRPDFHEWLTTVTDIDPVGDETADPTHGEA